MEIEPRLEPALKSAVAFRKKAVKEWVRKSKQLKHRLAAEVFLQELADLKEIEALWKR